MSLFAFVLVGQLTAPLLAFPEPGVDDTAAYRGYHTRLYRDAARNTVQVYVDQREGRVVHLLADAENASIAFSARAGRAAAPISLRWASEGATIGRSGRERQLTYDLVADTPVLSLGAFLLESMRVERDFQYWGKHRAAFSAPPFQLEETSRLLQALQQLDAGTRSAHLALLNAPTVPALRRRLVPALSARRDGDLWVAELVQPSLDARDTMRLEIRVDVARVRGTRFANAVVLRAREGGSIPFTVRIATTGKALTPLAREEIFSDEFLEFLAAARRAATNGGSAASRARWLERQARGVELLSSRDKLMAGLPTYATYFGRDMLVSALMMRGIWRPEMSEFAIASALGKLSPGGEVSHEEALGGQAVREAVAEYATLVDGWTRARARRDGSAADSLLARATEVLRDHRRVRENYHMIDDELQLPVLAARWLTDPRVTTERKRAFLLNATDGAPRLGRLLRELAVVARMTAPYVASPVAASLIAFAPRDTTWASTSWRDSGAGYAGGRYAMDVNAIWAPHALGALHQILVKLRDLGFTDDDFERSAPGVGRSALAAYLRDPALARAAATTWRGAYRHFLVTLPPAEVDTRIRARLAAMPLVERAHWEGVLGDRGASRDSLAFLALSLDAQGLPIGVANTDPATQLFLGETGDDPAVDTPETMATVLRDVRVVLRAYPVGLFIDRVGPVVANDAYASPAVWRAFEKDPYHGPRVAWGREVNLLLLGIARHIAAAGDTLNDPVRRAYVAELREAAARVMGAVEASGFHSELWSYAFAERTPAPTRYGSGADVQLWSTTDLAVRFALSRLGLER